MRQAPQPPPLRTFRPKKGLPRSAKTLVERFRGPRIEQKSSTAVLAYSGGDHLLKGLPTLLLSPNERLSKAQLDQYLLAGYRTIGQQLYTCDFIRTEQDEVYGCVQVRLPVQDLKLKYKQRRMLRRLGQRFEVKINPVTEVTREMREVNRRYMNTHPDKSRPDLEFHVGYYPEKRFIDTQQVEVYDRGKLIAFSFFDAGHRCMYSKAGIYNTAYQKESLGIYTMLLEIEWARENGVEYYHPGYVSCSYTMFNYKLRLGPMEYRDPRNGQWIPLPDNDPSFPPDPLELHRDAMLKLAAALRRVGVRSHIKEYPSFTARFYYPNHGGNLVDAPMVLQLDDGIPAGRLTLVNYDHFKGGYTLFNPGLSSLTDIKLQPFGPSGVRRYPRPVPVEIIHADNVDLQTVIDICEIYDGYEV